MTHVPTTPRRLRLVGASLAIAAAVMLGGAAAVSAYTPPGSVLSTVRSCSSTNPGASCNLQFQLKDANGNPVCNATVTFTTSGVAGSTVKPTTATTDCNTGNVDAVFTAGSGCGTATITASSPPASTQTTINVPCGTGTLPNTSTLPPTTFPWLGLLALLASLVVAGGGVALRRTHVAS